MRPTSLVLTTVHHPDDTRIREKLIRSLGADFEVSFAVRHPGPRDLDGLTWVPLRGGRVWRNVLAWRLALFGRYDVLSLHDPELLPLGLLVSLVRRKRKVVFDVHEDVPAQIRTKAWLPAPLRRPTAWVAKRLLRLAERFHSVTLAEAGYRSLFVREHPVFVNHPDAGSLPPVTERRTATVVYVGDITAVRGVREAVAAAGAAGLEIHVVGPASPSEHAAIAAAARDAGAGFVMHGRVTHRRAMELVGRSAVGVSPLSDIPNYRDSQPTKVLEYLAMGVPVVATDLPGTRALVEGLDAVWLVPAGEITAMAHALTEAATPGARGAAIAQAVSVRERFRWPADEVAAFYRRLVS